MTTDRLCKNCQNCVTNVTPAGPIYYCSAKPKLKGVDGEEHLYMVQADNTCKSWLERNTDV